MTFPYFKPMAIACAFVLAVIVAFFAGQAFAAPPDRPEMTVPLAPVSPVMFGSETGVAARLVQAKLFSDWVNGVRFSDAITTQNVGPGTANPVGQTAGQQFADAPGPARSPSLNGDCQGFPIPWSIIQRESGGSHLAVNPSSGAIGCSQTLPSHYSERGTCAGLDMYTVDGQRDCTQRLVDVAGLSPWAG